MIKSPKILFHITGYQNSRQFEWLFRAIYNENDLFLVHVDKKAPNDVHSQFRTIAGNRPNVVFLPSIAVTWGGCGLIEAEAAAILYALEHDPFWTHLVNLSAQDYPLVSLAALREELNKSWPSNYVLCNDICKVHWRIRKRRSFRYIEWSSQRFFTPIPKFKPGRLKIDWVGPWWHILTREFCLWLATHPKARQYLSYLRSAGMPDEFLIQNVILDSPFKDRVISCCKHEILWRRPGEPRASSARPKVFKMQDLPALEASKAFFARKFDHHVDEEVLMALASRHQFDVPRLDSFGRMLAHPDSNRTEAMPAVTQSS